MVQTPYLVLFIVIIAIGVGTIPALVTISVPENDQNTNFSQENSDFGLRSIDSSDSPKKSVDLHETQVGNQYKNPLKKSVPNSNWQESHIAKQRTIEPENVQQNVSFEFFSEMPTPSQKVIDRFEKKANNPIPRKVPLWENTNDTNPTLKSAINIDAFLDAEKKSSLKIESQTNSAESKQTDKAKTSQENKRAPIDFDVDTVTVGITAIISEPSADIHNDIVFMTGNTWAARSDDGGQNFSFVNPFSDFPLLCCDQDVIYNEKNNVWVWYRQGLADFTLGGSGDKNQVKLSVSTDDAITWCTYTLDATDINPGLTDHFVDYPHLQATDDKLYVSTNIFDNIGSDTFTAMLRFDFANLAPCPPSASYQVFLSSTEFNFTPVNGAEDTMYFATQVSPTQTKIHSWPDSSLILSDTTVTYPAYEFAGYDCTLTSTGTNPCGRSDTRVMGGYLSDGVLGFVWDAAQGGAFAFPYVNFITVDEAIGTILANTPIFSPTVATNFANFGVTDAGDIGIGLFQMGGDTNPRFLVGINDSQTGTNEFDFSTVKTSSHGTAVTNQWGDYIRIKPLNPDNGNWMGTGFTMQGGTTSSDVENLFVTFGRTSFCAPPESGDWIVTSDCTLSESTVIDENLIIQENVTLTISSGTTLTIANGSTFTNHGTLANNGTLTNNGTVNNENEIINNDVLNNFHTINNNGPITNNSLFNNFGIIENDCLGLVIGAVVGSPPVNICIICAPPSLGDWIVNFDCSMATNAIANGNIVVQNDSVLVIPDGVTLDINFAIFNLTIESGSKIVIQSGGTIT